ncbi:MAG: hypothetical protein K6F57_04515, partial [Candidatus Saccharibacteria bacterium]|nr:hypothetical protein [Candidatus Saccharibacteria bacterium]
MVKTAKESYNPTRALYDAPAQKEKKVNLTTTIITAAITMAIGVLIGINFDAISNKVNTALGQKTADSMDFSQLE